MEFLTKNILNTSTMLIVNSATSTATNIITRSLTKQYVSSGFNNDLTQTSITVSFSQDTTVSRLGLIGINWKSFRAFYNGVTANTFSLTTTAATTTSNWSTNSETSMFITATPVVCTSVTFNILSTQVANSEKVLGHLYIADLLNDFDRVPSASNYTPMIVPKQQVHTLSDGGTRVNTVEEKFSAKIKLKYIDRDFRDELKSTYALRTEIGFVAFPTTTGWDEILYQCVWVGSFDGYKFSDNAATSGFDLAIDLREVPT
jgi:hypothetical protein